MKKTLISTCIVFIALALFSSTAFSWGVATHAYIGKELGHKYGYSNLQEMYGAMAPDIPWIMFDAPEDIRNAFGRQTHYEFERVANVAWWRSQRAFAYGFATHNEVWGADHWAHIQYKPPGSEVFIEPGYTKDQAQILKNTWYPNGNPGFWALVETLGKEPGFALFVAEAAIEHGIDILVKQNEDPTIGLSMFLAAWLRSPSVPWLLVRAYAANWDQTSLIMGAEKEFRQLIMLYGLALLQDDTVDAVAEIAATQFGYLIDPNEITPEELKLLAGQVLTGAITLCAPSYSAVLNYTIDAIADELD